MLNRRYLRHKLMQALYALEQAKNANYELALDGIRQHYQPSLEIKKESQDLKKIKENQKTALNLFIKNYQNTVLNLEDDKDLVVKEEVQNRIHHLHNQNLEENRAAQQNLQLQLSSIYDSYIKILSFLPHLADYFVELQKESQTNLPFQKKASFEIFPFIINSKIINTIRQNSSLESERIRRKVNWDDEKSQDFVIEFAREIRKDEDFQKAILENEKGWKREQAIIRYIIRQGLFKYEIADGFLEHMDMNWEENRKIILSMVNKTIQEIQEENSEDFQLSKLSKNWEEDERFYKKLLKKALEENERYEKIIESKAKNWDLSRLAFTDRVILKMALAELLHFQDIPVKVSINEYIELAKQYSTPKSKKFINGLLDSITQNLIQQKEIRKSGRGLMDNR